MPRLEYFLVAESLSVDAATNRVSIFNVLEEVPVPIVPGFPVPLPSMVAIACWVAEPGDETRDFQASFAAHVPGEPEPRRFEVNFRMLQRRARTVLTLQWLPLTAPGEMLLEVSLNGRAVAHHSISITLAVPAATQH